MKNYPSLKNLTSPTYGNNPEKQHKVLQDVAKAHIDSFNYLLREGLQQSVQNIPPVEMQLPSGQRVSFTFKEVSIKPPMVADGNQYATTLKVYPAECRERGSTYRGKCQIQLMWTIDGRRFGPIEKVIGEVPIMVKSSVCNLSGLNPNQLVERGEEAEEFGGYFIINGNERLIRQLIMPRRHFPNAIIRPSWKSRGALYTEYGVQMRCVAPDQSSSNIVVHYLNNGTANLCFSYKKEQFFVPVVLILKGLLDVPDKYIFQELSKGKEDNSFYKGCIANMLRQASAENLYTQTQVLKYIGQRFRIKTGLPEWKTDLQIAQHLFRECICIHLADNIDKFNIIIYMTRKLFAFAKGECCTESADNPAFQEVLLGGHLYQMLLKEKIENWLISLKTQLEKVAQKKGPTYTIDQGEITYHSRHTSEVTRPMEYLMATGNLVSKTGLGLMQASGLTIVADKLNYFRYLSHFRSIHRGAFFAEMRTTAVRKLLPEAWGFLCPVHTPDGTPCGLLNHLTASCQVVNHTYKVDHLEQLLLDLGMHTYERVWPGGTAHLLPVMLNGRMIGWLEKSDANEMAEQLRLMKVQGLHGVPQTLEIALVPPTDVASQYPGLFLFSSVARMVRPVSNLALQRTELIGSFEQVYMNIAVIPEEAIPELTTHLEISETSMLSVLANFTPFSDFNQSPRNMYQCQMGKQTMGTPCHALSHRADNKLYRVQTPQSPLVRPAAHDYYMMDNYPLGTNAIVAVISYTGYDMEDAMILNKSSYERGFAHGSVYKSEFINLKDDGDGNRYKSAVIFGVPAGKTVEGLQQDGLPAVGTYLKQGVPYYSTINLETGISRVQSYKSMEPAYVDQIKVLGDDLGQGMMQRVCMVLRIVRNPIIGDKFSSRHGQKGICSQKWPVENMPFSETGMTPDILFNPHGFPSRMTIGMMIESMAGKSASMHGLVHDATPFTFSEDNSAVTHFGELLSKAGYNYQGTERMYSGVDGREFEADIFIGVVYYQRLRHMVSDKFQVRTTGPIDQVTHQPVKGRKRHGGVRFGEMERDGLISHGTSFLLHDRLFNNSDRCLTQVCGGCGSVLSPLMPRGASDKTAAATYEQRRTWNCMVCDNSRNIHTIAVPYVFRYMTAEFAAMNIKVTLDVRQG